MFTLKETFSNLNLYLTSKVLMGGGTWARGLPPGVQNWRYTVTHFLNTGESPGPNLFHPSPTAMQAASQWAAGKHLGVSTPPGSLRPKASLLSLWVV